MVWTSMLSKQSSCRRCQITWSPLGVIIMTLSNFDIRMCIYRCVKPFRCNIRYVYWNAIALWILLHKVLKQDYCCNLYQHFPITFSACNMSMVLNISLMLTSCDMLMTMVSWSARDIASGSMEWSRCIARRGPGLPRIWSYLASDWLAEQQLANQRSC